MYDALAAGIIGPDGSAAESGAAAASAAGVENKLVQLLGFDHFDLAKELLKNRCGVAPGYWGACRSQAGWHQVNVVRGAGWHQVTGVRAGPESTRAKSTQKGGIEPGPGHGVK